MECSAVLKKRESFLIVHFLLLLQVGIVWWTPEDKPVWVVIQCGATKRGLWIVPRECLSPRFRSTTPSAWQRTTRHPLCQFVGGKRPKSQWTHRGCITDGRSEKDPAANTNQRTLECLHTGIKDRIIGTVIPKVRSGQLWRLWCLWPPGFGPRSTMVINRWWITLVGFCVRCPNPRLSTPPYRRVEVTAIRKLVKRLCCWQPIPPTWVMELPSRGFEHRKLACSSRPNRAHVQNPYSVCNFFLFVMVALRSIC